MACVYTKNSVRWDTPNSCPSVPKSTPHSNQVNIEATTPAFGLLQAPSMSNFSRERELRLMHKYSTETYKSLSNEPADYHLWQMIVPQMALEFDFLMNGLLAVTSLHTATSIASPEVRSFIDSGLEYHNQASALYRRALNDISPTNCDAVFAQAIITTVIGISLPQLTADRMESTTMVENILVVFELLRGLNKILIISRSWPRTELSASRRSFFEMPDTPLDADSDTSLTKLMETTKYILGNTDPEQYHTMEDAIGVLRMCFRRFAYRRDAGSVLSWLSIIDEEFVCALRAHKTIALLVLMHWTVLLNELNGKMWWAHNSGIALGTELLEELHSSDIQLEEALIWPKKMLGI